MNKREGLQKHTLHLREGDMERLRSLYPEVGASLVIRKLVSTFLDRDSKDRKLEISGEEIEL